MTSQNTEQQKNTNNILDFSEKNIKNDIMYFKEELLKDMKVVQRQYSDKFSHVNDMIKLKIEQYDYKLQAFENKIIELANKIQTDKTIRETVKSLEAFKENTNNSLMTGSIRMKNLEEYTKSNISNLQDIISDSVIYPGIIGSTAKFKTFHEFIDFTLTQISNLNNFKDKNIADLIPYKKKIDNTVDELKIQINSIIDSNNKFTLKNVDACEERVKGLISLYDDRLQDTRVENAHYAIGLEKKAEELTKLIQDVETMKKEISTKVENETKSLNSNYESTKQLFYKYKKDFNVIKDRFTQLGEFIKDIRFRINIGEEIKRREYYCMANKIDFTKKQTVEELMAEQKKIRETSAGGGNSAIRKYINGEINAEELLSFNHKHNENIIPKNLQKRKSAQFNALSAPKYKRFSRAPTAMNTFLNLDDGKLNAFMGSKTMDRKKTFADIRLPSSNFQNEMKINEQSFDKFIKTNTLKNATSYDEKWESNSESEESNSLSKENLSKSLGSTFRKVTDKKNENKNFIIKEEDEMSDNSKDNKDNKDKEKVILNLKKNEEEKKQQSETKEKEVKIENKEIKMQLECNEKIETKKDVENKETNRDNKDIKENQEKLKLQENKDNKEIKENKEMKENKENTGILKKEGTKISLKSAKKLVSKNENLNLPMPEKCNSYREEDTKDNATNSNLVISLNSYSGSHAPRKNVIIIDGSRSLSSENYIPSQMQESSKNIKQNSIINNPQPLTISSAKSFQKKSNLANSNLTQNLISVTSSNSNNFQSASNKIQSGKKRQFISSSRKKENDFSPLQNIIENPSAAKSNRVDIKNKTYSSFPNFNKDKNSNINSKPGIKEQHLHTVNLTLYTNNNIINTYSVKNESITSIKKKRAAGYSASENRTSKNIQKNNFDRTSDAKNIENIFNNLANYLPGYDVKVEENKTRGAVSSKNNFRY